MKRVLKFLLSLFGYELLLAREDDRTGIVVFNGLSATVDALLIKKKSIQVEPRPSAIPTLGLVRRIYFDGVSVSRRWQCGKVFFRIIQ